VPLLPRQLIAPEEKEEEGLANKGSTVKDSADKGLADKGSTDKSSADKGLADLNLQGSRDDSLAATGTATTESVRVRPSQSFAELRQFFVGNFGHACL
jgi:hypothetical protein